MNQLYLCTFFRSATNGLITAEAITIKKKEAQKFFQEYTEDFYKQVKVPSDLESPNSILVIRDNYFFYENKITGFEYRVHLQKIQDRMYDVMK